MVQIKEMATQPLGFITDYTKYTAAKVPSDRLWLENQAFFLVSLAAGIDVYIPGRMGNINLNLFFINRGASRIAFKSLSLDSFCRPILRKLSKILKKKLMMPKEYTREAIIGYFSHDETKKEGKKNITYSVINNEGGIIYDEFSTVFKENTKTYQGSMLEFYSEMYTGWIDGRMTKTHGFEGNLSVYVSLLAATTDEFLRGLEKSFFNQGTGNRFLYTNSEPQALPKPIDKEGNRIPLFGLASTANQDNFENDLKEFAERLAVIRQNCPKIIDLSPQASLAMDEYYFYNHDFACNTYRDDRDSLLYSYYSESSILMLKLAAIYTISINEKMIAEGLYEGRVLQINKKAIKWAQERMKQYIANFHEMLNRWPQVQAKGSLVKTAEEDYRLILALIQENLGKDDLPGISMNQLRSLTLYKEHDFNRLIRSMELNNMIERYEIEKKDRGRPETRYRIKEP